ELIKKLAVMNHRLAQIFRSGLATRTAGRDFMRGPVIFHNQWMVHGDIRRPLFKLTYGITAGGHHVAEQLVCLGNRIFRAVNELRLNLVPGSDVALPVAGRERPDGKSLDTFFSSLETGFRLPPASAFFDRARIFR